jgi:hypothetical protein
VDAADAFKELAQGIDSAERSADHDDVSPKTLLVDAQAAALPSPR